MDTMPSSEFRRRYATLTKPTAITVNGHVIGEWLPASVARSFTGPSEPQRLRIPPYPDTRDAEVILADLPGRERFNTQPMAAAWSRSQPVPKVRKR